MINCTSRIFYLNTADLGGWDMLYGTAKTIVNKSTTAYLFKAHPIEMDGQTYYQLKCYNADGTLRLSGLDGGNGDGVNVTTGSNPVLFIGSTRENGPYAYGQDLVNGSIWDIQPKNGGFTFRSISANKKYIGTSGQSSSAVVWKAYSRYSFLNNPPTGISDAPQEQIVNSKSVNGKCFDLQGRLVHSVEANSSKATGRRDSGNLFTLHSSLKRGIYIINGKKVVIR